VWITFLEDLFTDTHILGEIDTAIVFNNDFIESVEEVKEPFFYLEIERKAIPL
jgi:hypothetical protein